ncbi:hypothetical protein SAICODRAFT_28452 [Saitoella complicata NRRL Y-17804]|uniref:uncharacterized protein n=1 Tax=Saitoella complicata (strain BCRC 22490 / CBS 7301 / JCM 7358 / NBRC 10748 / NRRL Y-17804) TaxID=698492 RepID=UPI0008674376|nr:uncharacterized protein SAICODRAFT_28452 [Saitoella complicata NRRL Y-17804]ODQ56220.1 hypothetical protein SAICODRAFT_28452 [Saitoella complicata NRRL Y-17804]
MGKVYNHCSYALVLSCTFDRSIFFEFTQRPGRLATSEGFAHLPQQLTQSCSTQLA